MDGYWKWVAVGAVGVTLFALKRYLGGTIYRPRGYADGKTVVITGANCGIGKATALQLAKLRARVVLACRDVKRGEDAVKDIRRYTKEGDLVVRELDLASFASIRQFAEEIKNAEERIDVLINNAAVFQCPYSQTKDGLEMQMGVNYLGHFLLTNLLLDKITTTPQSRIIVVSSGLAKRGKLDLENFIMNEDNYDHKAGYNNSKLACDYFSRELARRLGDSGTKVHCLSPGMVRTDLGRHVQLKWWMKILIAPLWFLLVKSPYQGCQTVLYCSLSDDLNGVTGKFYRNCAQGDWPEEKIDDSKGSELWKLSAKLVNM